MKLPANLPFGTRVRVRAYLCRRSAAGWSYRRADKRYMRPPWAGHGRRVDGTPVPRGPDTLPPLPVPTRWWEACPLDGSYTAGVVIGASVVYSGAKAAMSPNAPGDDSADWFEVSATIGYVEVAIETDRVPYFVRCLPEDLEVIS
jgi:hypothetical protein